MATKLKIKKVSQNNPSTGASGYATRVVTNGTMNFDDLAAEAASNTTMHKKEMTAAVGIFLDAVTKYIKQGYIVDLGDLGKLYPSCSGKWTASADGQKKENLTLYVNYRASEDISAAIKGATLTWTNADDEAADSDDDTTDTGSTGSGSGLVEA